MAVKEAQYAIFSHSVALNGKCNSVPFERVSQPKIDVLGVTCKD